MFGTSTRSGYRRGCGSASWRPPSTLLTRSTFPVHYPVLAPERGPQMANPRPTPKPGNLGPPWPPCTSGNMSSTCSVLPRDLVSVEVAAEQVGAHPQTLLTRSTFPVHYPVLAPERGARWQTHAQRRNLRISVRPGHRAPAATL